MSNREVITANDYNRSVLKYKQNNFVILELFKRDGINFNIVNNKNLKLISQRTFQVGTKKDDALSQRIMVELKVGVIDDESDGEALLDENFLIRIKTVTNFKLEEDRYIPEVIPNMMVQANIQTTDIVNIILRNSEFIGGEITYDL